MNSKPATDSNVPDGVAESASVTGGENAFATLKGVRFLVGDVEALPLRAFEVAFTTSFLIWIGHCLLTWREWLTEAGFHLSASELSGMGYAPPFPLLSGPGVFLLGTAIGVAGLAHVLNRRRRLALLVLFCSAIYIQGVDWMMAFSLNRLYVGVYGILLIAPGYTRDVHTGRLQVSALAVRMIQATLILQYFAAGLAKVFRGDWLKSGDVLYTQVQGVYRTDFAAWLLRILPVWCWSVVQWAVLLFELQAILIFCWRKLRTLAFVLGMGFHLLMALTMKDLIFSSLQMWSFYALFITANEWRSIGAALTRSLGGAPENRG